MFAERAAEEEIRKETLKRTQKLSEWISNEGGK